MNSEKDAVLELITSAEEGVLPVGCLAQLLRAVDDAFAKRRRDAQTWGPNALNIFTEAELTRFRDGGQTAMNDTLADMFARIKSLGGKNIDEHDKKLFTAMWLHFRGDGAKIGRVGREAAFTHSRWLGGACGGADAEGESSPRKGAWRARKGRTSGRPARTETGTERHTPPKLLWQYHICAVDSSRPDRIMNSNRN